MTKLKVTVKKILHLASNEHSEYTKKNMISLRRNKININLEKKV